MQENRKKWLEFGTSIFTQMTVAARKANALNLAQGYPDFDGPTQIVEAAFQAMKDGKNQYAPSTGIPELRALLSDRMKSRSGLEYCPNDEVTVYSGATEALFLALSTLVNPGDEVLAFAPVFDCYAAGCVNAGAELKLVPLTPPNWQIDWDALEAAVSPKTSTLLLNMPHNPTGRVLTEAESRKLASFVERHDLLVITDEVYEELVFEPAKHRTFAAEPGMRDRTLVISSTSKTYSMTGWKIGYAFGCPELTRPMRAMHQFTVFSSATPLQYGMVAALQMGDQYYQDFRESYRQKRDLLHDVLTKHGFRCTLPEGSYFIMADYSELSTASDFDFALELIEKAGVASIPTSPFYNGHPSGEGLRYLRFAFCKQEETIRAADRRFKESLPFG